MAVTVTVNGQLTLSHKGSGGWVKATLPDVCKTPGPGGPVPVPYPALFSFSRDLQNGTKTVTADGGNSCSIAGSEYARATGDEAGTAGGVASGVNTKEATWISSSQDVKFESRGACRLTDKMLMNKGNTVSLGGDMEVMLLGTSAMMIELDPILRMLCMQLCKCLGDRAWAKGKVMSLPHVGDIDDWILNGVSGPRFDEASYGEPDVADGYDPYYKPRAFYNQVCVEDELAEWKYPAFIAEQTYDMYPPVGPDGKHPPPAPADPVFRGTRGTRRPDVVIMDRPGVPAGLNLLYVVEMKFPGDSERKNQYRDYLKIAQRNNDERGLLILMTKDTCRCEKEQEKEEEKPSERAVAFDWLEDSSRNRESDSWHADPDTAEAEDNHVQEAAARTGFLAVLAAAAVAFDKLAARMFFIIIPDSLLPPGGTDA